MCAAVEGVDQGGEFAEGHKLDALMPAPAIERMLSRKALVPSGLASSPDVQRRVLLVRRHVELNLVETLLQTYAGLVTRNHDGALDHR
jgi:hypothetical protein